jgi:hypothetical protein
MHQDIRPGMGENIEINVRANGRSPLLQLNTLSNNCYCTSDIQISRFDSDIIQSLGQIACV